MDEEGVKGARKAEGGSRTGLDLSPQSLDWVSFDVISLYS